MLTYLCPIDNPLRMSFTPQRTKDTINLFFEFGGPHITRNSFSAKESVSSGVGESFRAFSRSARTFRASSLRPSSKRSNSLTVVKNSPTPQYPTFAMAVQSTLPLFSILVNFGGEANHALAKFR